MVSRDRLLRRVVVSVVVVLIVAACGDDMVEPSVSFVGDDCSSSDPGKWPSGPLDIEVSNSTETSAAVVMGTYQDGFGHDDLVAYGSDISTRPDFIDALEIFEAAPESTSSLSFDYGPGTYFMVCLPDNNTMVVLDDVAIEG